MHTQNMPQSKAEIFKTKAGTLSLSQTSAGLAEAKNSRYAKYSNARGHTLPAHGGLINHKAVAAEFFGFVQGYICLMIQVAKKVTVIRVASKAQTA